MNYTIAIATLTLVIIVLLTFFELGNEYFYYSIPNSKNVNNISNLTTNKFLYPAGYISSDDCSKRCNERFEECSKNFPIGGSNWCSYLKTECDRECKWNSVFN